jgi:hypothetical protein
MQVVILILFQIISWLVKVKEKGKVVPVLLAEHHVMKAYCGNGGIAPRILDLGTRWRRVVSFTSRALYPREEPLVPIG